MKPVDVKKDNYLYELCCFFKIALAAKKSFNIHLAGAITGTANGRPAAKWPKSPAEKKHYSYFSLIDPADGQEKFQLCPGVKILDKNSKSRAPDINLLKGGAMDNPDYSDVLSIWDAKYTTNISSRLSDIAVSDFVFTYLQLDSPKTPSGWVEQPPFRSDTVHMSNA